MNMPKKRLVIKINHVVNTGGVQGDQENKTPSQ